SYLAPTDIGSGGRGTRDSGGGAVILNVTSTVTIQGSILANGAVDVWGGSGGSIFITASGISGNGTLSAVGGASGQSAAAGGGRIAVIASTSSWTGVTKAWGNPGSFSNTSAA